MTARWLALALLALSPGLASAADMRARCARVGDDDRAIPIDASLVGAARAAFGLAADAPADWVVASTVARCMGGAVWLCNAGANIPCGKADANRRNAGASAFCRQNPGAQTVPMSATGHATIYGYVCDGTRARVTKKFGAVDARGFVADSWKRLD